MIKNFFKYIYPNYFYKKKTLKFINKTLNPKGNFQLKREITSVEIDYTDDVRKITFNH